MRFPVKFAVGWAAAAAIFAAAPGAYAAALPPKLILPEELPIPEELSSLDGLIVTVVGETVCVTDGDGNVVYDTGVAARRLTEGDRALLEKGIPATDYLSLIRLIESYMG